MTDKKSKWEKIQEAGFDLSAIKKVIITEELTEASELIQGLKDWLKGAPKDIPLRATHSRRFGLYCLYVGNDR